MARKDNSMFGDEARLYGLTEKDGPSKATIRSAARNEAAYGKAPRSAASPAQARAAAPQYKPQSRPAVQGTSSTNFGEYLPPSPAANRPGAYGSPYGAQPYSAQPGQNTPFPRAGSGKEPAGPAARFLTAASFLATVLSFVSLFQLAVGFSLLFAGAGFMLSLFALIALRGKRGKGGAVASLVISLILLGLLLAALLYTFSYDTIRYASF